MISIILPMYNAERFITFTIQSVLEQTYTEWELIVVDDGSKDNAPALVQSFASKDCRIRLVTQSNAGCAAARNQGRKHISPATIYVIFLDHDDLWEPDALTTLLTVANSHPDAVAAIGGANKVQEADVASTFEKLQQKSKSLSIGISPEETTPSSIVKMLTFDEMATFCAALTMGQVLIRRDVLDAVGPFNLQCVPADDWELYLRLILRGPIVAFDKAVIYWRDHANNTSKNYKLMYQAEMQVRLALLARPDLTPSQRQSIRDGFCRAKNSLAAGQWKNGMECLSKRNLAQALKQMRRAIHNAIRARTIPSALKG